MRLVKVEYSENLGRTQEWTLDPLILGQSNLVVGKNSAGKSRTLALLNGVAAHLLGEIAPGGGSEYICTFHDGETVLVYEVTYLDGVVTHEQVTRDGEVLLERGEDGKGMVFAEQVGFGTRIPFQTGPSEFAAAVRRDPIQHSFLEPLHEWARSARFYQFGRDLGKWNLAIIVPNAPPVNERDQSATAGIFRRTDGKYPQFAPQVIADMATIGYDITEIGLGQQVSVKFDPNVPVTPLGMYVQERGLPGLTDQVGMSQGMWRSLALLIHVNALQMRGDKPFVIIDDIGEGLDFERSCKLIALLRAKASDHDIQLVLSTNDRFVMNEVPLDEWTVLLRSGNHVEVKNAINSKDIFEEFRFTGLSNFSFFEMGMINTLLH